MTISQLFAPTNIAERIVSGAIAAVKMRDKVKVDYVSPWRKKLARAAQIAPVGLWFVWIFLGGRGAGKTRAGAEWTHERVRAGCKRIALVAPTASDVKKIMVLGASGIMATCPDDLKPIKYWPSLLKVTYSNGAELHLYSAEKADRLRGPGHDGSWADEPMSWKNIDTDLDNLTESTNNPWHMLMFTLREGSEYGIEPQVMVSGTPRPIRWLKALLKDKTTVMTKGSSYDNVKNLAKSFVHNVLDKYKGTRIGRQEVYAEILEDIPGALWTPKMISDAQINMDLVPPLAVIRIAVDPSVSKSKNSAETGIMAGGRAECNCKGSLETHAFILDDLTIDGPVSADQWARRTARGYAEYMADGVIGEVNNGGDLVEVNLRTVNKRIAYRKVTASRGKYKRAEPVSMLYERGEVHHVRRTENGVEVSRLTTVEDQLLLMTKDDEYDLIDRADALVWLLTDLMLDEPNEWHVS